MKNILGILKKLANAVVWIVFFVSALTAIALYVEQSTTTWPKVASMFNSIATPETLTLAYRFGLLIILAVGFWRLVVLEERLDTKAQTLTLSSEIFMIEHLEHEVRLRNKDGAMLDQLHPGQPPAPSDTIFVLEIRIKITSVPARIVEDIILSIAGNRIYLHPGDWRRRQVGIYESHLSFDIPPDIRPAYHKAHFIMEGEGGMEVRSPVFRVTLSRSYVPPNERE